MLRSFTSVCTLLLSVLVSASLQAQTVSQPPASPPPAAPPKVGFAIIKTSQVAVPQALLQFHGDETPERCAAAGIELRIPALSLCTDNGAMIAALGAQLVMAGRQPSSLSFGADSTLPVTTVQTL